MQPHSRERVISRELLTRHASTYRVNARLMVYVSNPKSGTPTANRDASDGSCPSSSVAAAQHAAWAANRLTSAVTLEIIMRRSKELSRDQALTRNSSDEANPPETITPQAHFAVGIAMSESSTEKVATLPRYTAYPASAKVNARRARPVGTK